MALGCGIAFWLAVAESVWSVIALGISVIVAQCVRSFRTVHRVQERVSVNRALWVGSETAVVASAPLLVNIIVLAALSASDAVAFRLVLTVLGVLQPLLGYLRTRLLLRPSPTLTISLSIMTLAALVGVVIADVVGVFDLIFADAWDAVSLGALLAACLWKAASVPATLPFARMRRRGSLQQVFLARLLSAAIYVLLGSAAALTAHSLTVIFCAIFISEVVTFAVYTLADRRSRS